MTIRGPKKEFLANVRRLLEELQGSKSPEKPQPLPPDINVRLEELTRLTKEFAQIAERTISGSGINEQDLDDFLKKGMESQIPAEKELLQEVAILKDKVDGIQRDVAAERKKRQKKEKKGSSERKKKFDRTGARFGWKPL